MNGNKPLELSTDGTEYNDNIDSLLFGSVAEAEEIEIKEACDHNCGECERDICLNG